ncbi:unnamed protein product [Citrullus colocynthis]|uniref:Secreted protein n=1 Tax=Citrullus colocynthis TaxID=252529 RepID=A0ABP0ZAT3_9ROSI
MFWLARSLCIWRSFAGATAVVHDSSGSLILGGCEKVGHNWSIKFLEALTLIREDLSELSSFVEEIGTLGASARVVFFCRCMQSANGLTHCMARVAVLGGDWVRFFISYSSSSSEEVVRILCIIPDYFSSVFEGKGCGCCELL